jgi:hypothetical protein
VYRSDVPSQVGLLLEHGSVCAVGIRTTSGCPAVVLFHVAFQRILIVVRSAALWAAESEMVGDVGFAPIHMVISGRGAEKLLDAFCDPAR